MKKVVEGEVFAVLHCENYQGCIECNAKLSTQSRRCTAVILAECSKCKTLIKLRMCKNFLTAQVIVAEDNGKQHHLTLFTNIITSIVDRYTNDENLKKKVTVYTSNSVCCRHW